MSWITVVWPMIGGACLTLAAMHLLVWMKDRRAGASLAFAGVAVCVACIAAFELAMTRAQPRTSASRAPNRAVSEEV